MRQIRLVGDAFQIAHHLLGDMHVRSVELANPEDLASGDAVAQPHRNAGRVDEAREALHQMEIGRAEVSLSYNGESVTYAATNIGALRQYVRDLEAKLGLASQRDSVTIGGVTYQVINIDDDARAMLRISLAGDI